MKFNAVDTVIGLLLGTLIAYVFLNTPASDRPERPCPAHIPCAVPQWDREPRSLEEWEARVALMREMQERCGHKVAEERGAR